MARAATEGVQHDRRIRPHDGAVEEWLAAHGERWLDPGAVAHTLGAAGITLPPFAIVTSAQEAAAAAENVDFPVTVKVISRTLTHKSDFGVVVLDLPSAAAVEQACTAMLARVPAGAEVEGLLVQQMITGGVVVIVGVVDDGTFGPLLGFGLGGTAVEDLNDVVFRITPLTDADAHEMIHAIRGLPFLQGYRGRPSADLAAIEDLLLRLSWLVEAVPEIVEMDANPVADFAAGEGLALVDVRRR